MSLTTAVTGLRCRAARSFSAEWKMRSPRRRGCRCRGQCDSLRHRRALRGVAPRYPHWTLAEDEDEASERLDEASIPSLDTSSLSDLTGRQAGLCVESRH